MVRCEMLIREGDHRIKNSLQLVSSLMSGQASREESPIARDALRSAAARVQTIARVHDALERGKGADVVEVGAMILDTCEALQTIAAEPGRMKVVAHADPLPSPVSFAQPILLIVNELVLNALRHAFPADAVGVVRVSFERVAEGCQLIVADDGVGLPPGYEEARGYGIKLVNMLVRQIGGALSIRSGAGSTFTIIVRQNADPVAIRRAGSSRNS